MDFNDNDSDDEDNGILSADYIAQRKTTQDLVDFFKSAPPPSSSTPLNLSPIEDEKKKKPLLQWLRPKKSGSNLSASASSIAGGSTLGGGTASGRNSMLAQGAGATSNISTVSGVTMGKGKNGEDITTSTLPNGRKYIMIAVDYKEGDDGTGLPPQPRSAGSTNSDVMSISNGSSLMTTTRLPNGGTVSRRQSRVPDDALTIEGLSPGAAAAKRLSVLSSTFGGDLNGSGGGEKRRSILQTNGNATDRSSINDGSKYVLGGGSFLLENFALDADFMGQATGASASGEGPASSEPQRSASNKSGATGPGGGAGGESAGISRTDSKRGNKVKVSFLGDPNADDVPMDEAVVAEALAQRLASYKVQPQGKSITTTTTTTSTSTTTTTDGGGSGTSQDPQQQDYPEIVLPKPVSRKKVRHVQIQTQHCVMRAMHTQTEPYENLVYDLDVKEWSSAPPSISGSTEVGSTTAFSTITFSSFAGPNSLGKKDASTGVVTSAKPNSKVASLAASLTQPTAATTATTTTLVTCNAATSPTTTSPPTPFPNPIDNNGSLESPTTTNTTSTTTSTTSTEISTEISTETSSPSSPTDPLLREELAQLREQNAALQAKVSSLQRDLAAETRARNRTTVAMQDTRDKFEMLSAMAYKKLKEMIFQRHILEMEVRELRTQVDLHSEVSVVREGEMLFRQEQQQQQQQMMHHHQQQQYLYQTA